MLLIRKTQIILDDFLGLIRRYVMELIVLMFVSLFVMWSFAFLANGLFDYHFDLASCWGGFSAIGGAGFLAAVKYCTDSWKNSPDGISPESFMKYLDRNGDGHISITEAMSTITDKVKDLNHCPKKEGIKNDCV